MIDLDKKRNLSIKTLKKFLRTDKLYSDTKNYLSKIDRALQYKRNYPFPSNDETDDIHFRYGIMREYDKLNVTVRTIDPKVSQKLAPLGNPFFLFFRNHYPVLSNALSMLKKEIQDNGGFFGNEEPYSPVWCSKEVLDFSRSMFSLIDKRLSETERNKNGEQRSENFEKLRPYFKSLSPIIKQSQRSNDTILHHISKCGEKGVFKSIFERRLDNEISSRNELSFLSSHEIDNAFNQFIDIGMREAANIQNTVMKTSVGKALIRYFKEKEL